MVLSPVQVDIWLMYEDMIENWDQYDEVERIAILSLYRRLIGPIG